MITPSRTEKMESFIRGSNIITGGTTDPAACYVAPTIITVSGHDDPVMQEEIFGPVLPVMTFFHMNEVCSFVNSREKPLALYYFSQSRARQNSVLRHTTAGGVCINDTIMHISNPHLPFGGVGSSGMGQYHGHHSFLAFSHAKPVLRKTTLFDLPIRYAPYRDSMLRLARRIFE